MSSTNDLIARLRVHGTFHEAVELIETLRRERDEAVRDAERYRHLRLRGVIVDFTHCGPWKFTDDVDNAMDALLTRKKSIDAAISILTKPASY